MTKTPSRTEVITAYMQWRREAGFPCLPAAARPEESAARLSYELRRELAERLARLGYGGDLGNRASHGGGSRDARPAWIRMQKHARRLCRPLSG